MSCNPFGLLEGVHLYRWLWELKSPGARPLWPCLALTRKVGVEFACAVPGVVPWGDLGAVGALHPPGLGPCPHHFCTLGRVTTHCRISTVSADVFVTILQARLGDRRAKNPSPRFTQKYSQNQIFQKILSERAKRAEDGAASETVGRLAKKTPRRLKTI